MNKIEYDLPIDRFSGSKGFESRIEEVDVFKILSSAEKLIYCIEKGYDLFTSMAKCRVSFGAMHSFQSAYDYFQSERKSKLMQKEAEFEQSYKRQYFPFPKDVGLSDHVYYKHIQSGEMITVEEYNQKLSEIRKEKQLCLKL